MSQFAERCWRRSHEPLGKKIKTRILSTSGNTRRGAFRVVAVEVEEFRSQLLFKDKRGKQSQSRKCFTTLIFCLINVAFLAAPKNYIKEKLANLFTESTSGTQ